MKFIHTADWHLGKVLGEFSLLEDQIFAMNGLLELLRREGADALVIAGDVYDRSVPPAAAVTAFDDFVSAAVGMGVKVLAIAGNHDSPQRLSFANRLVRSEGYFVEGSCTLPLAQVPVTGHDGVAVTFTLAPFTDRYQLRRLLPEGEYPTYTDAYRALLEGTPLPAGPNVLVAHGFFAGGEELVRSDSELSVGTGDLVAASALRGFDYACLGHLHAPQTCGRETARYSGSLLKYSLSEQGQKKAVAVVEIDAAGAVSVRQERLPVRRDLAVVRGSFEELASGALHPPGEDYLYAVIADNELVYGAVSRLRALYPNLLGVKLEARVQGEDLPDLTPQDDRPTDERFAAFYRDVKGMEPTPGQMETIRALLEKLEGEV